MTDIPVGIEHPLVSPGRHGRWPAVWRSQDVAIVLITLGLMVVIQWLLIESARAPARYSGLNGLAFAIFPTFVTAAGVLARARLRGLSPRDLGFVRPQN